MAFSVGSIEAELTLSRTPFQRGLEEARAEARAFARERIRPEVDVDVHGVDEAKARLESLRKRVTAHVDVDAGHAHAELDGIEQELRKVDGETASAEVKVEVAHALADLAAVRHEVNALDRERVSIPVETRGAPAAILALRAVETAAGGAGRHISGMAMAVGLGASGLAAFTPLVGGAAVGVGAFAGSMTAAGAGLGLFGAAAAGTFKQAATAAKGVEHAQKGYNMAVAQYGAHSKQAETAALKLQAAYKTIDPTLRPLVRTLQDVKSAWHSFEGALRPLVVQLATTALHGVRQVLPQLLPLAKAAGGALNQLASEASKALQGPFWQSFIHFLTRSAGPAITAFGHILGNLMHAFAALVMAFEPQSRHMEGALVRLSKRFADWATHLSSSGGFQRFLGYVHANMPQVIALLHQLGVTFGLLAHAMAAGGPAAGRLWVTIFQALNTVLRAIGPHAAGFIVAFAGIGLVLGKTLGPLVTIIGWLGKLGPAMSLAGTVAKLLFSTLRLGASMLLAFVAPAFSAVGAAVVTLSATIGAPVAVVVAAIAAIIAIGVLVVTHWKETKAVLSAIWGGIKEAAVAVWNAITAVVGAAVRATEVVVTAVWDAIKGATTAVWNAIKAVIEGVWNAIKSVVTGAASAVRGAVEGAWGAVSGATSSAWHAIKDVISTAWDAIKGGVSAGVGAVVSAVKSIPGKVLGVLKDLAGSALDAGKAVVQAIADGVTAGAEWVMSAVRNVISQAKSLLPFSEPKDPSSPLRRLDLSGRAILENMAAGIPAGVPAMKAALKGAMAGARATLDVGGGLGPMNVRAAGAGSVGVSHVTYGDVNFTMPTPVAGNGTPDPAHLRALLSEELRKLGRR